MKAATPDTDPDTTRWNGDGLSVVAHTNGNRLHIRAGDGTLETHWTLSQTDALALIAATANTRRFAHWDLAPGDTLSLIAALTSALAHPPDSRGR